MARKAIELSNPFPKPNLEDINYVKNVLPIEFTFSYKLHEQHINSSYYRTSRPALVGGLVALGTGLIVGLSLLSPPYYYSPYYSRRPYYYRTTKYVYRKPSGVRHHHSAKHCRR